MKDYKPHPCRRCKEGEVKRVNLCPNCVKIIATEVKKHYEQLDKERNNVVKQ